MKKLVVRSIVILLSLTMSGSVLADDLLFSRLRGADPLAGERNRDMTYRALADDKATAAIDILQVNSNLVSTETNSLSFDLGNGLELRAYRTEGKTTEDNMTVWTGVIEDVGMSGTPFLAEAIEFDPMNTVTIVKNGDLLTGNIHFAGDWYQLRPLRSGGHALVRVDMSQMPPDHPVGARMPVRQMPISEGKEDQRVVSTIRVMVHYTSSAAAASADINALINLAVSETNTGYTNSGVEISLVLAHKSQVTYTQSGSFSTDLTRYRGTTDGYMDTIHATRSSVAADVGVLIINNSSSCGLASGIGSTASTAFAVAHYSCATGYYSFGHEIGHLQSARHDPAADPSTSPYAYGHGYQKTSSPSWRTIMAYDCSAGCPRLNYWSNPAKTYGGAVMGTTSTHHNQRVLQETKATIAAFLNDPAPQAVCQVQAIWHSCCSQTGGGYYEYWVSAANSQPGAYPIASYSWTSNGYPAGTAVNYGPLFPGLPGQASSYTLVVVVTDTSGAASTATCRVP